MYFPGLRQFERLRCKTKNCHILCQRRKLKFNVNKRNLLSTLSFQLEHEEDNICLSKIYTSSCKTLHFESAQSLINLSFLNYLPYAESNFFLIEEACHYMQNYRTLTSIFLSFWFQKFSLYLIITK